VIGRVLVAVALAACSGCASAQPPQTVSPARTPSVVEFGAYVDSLLGEPKYRTATWGVLVVDPRSGDTLYSRNAGKLFVPASNQKVLTAAVALAELGPAFRFTTRFAHSGERQDSTIAGDLIVFGTGDPSFSDRIRGDAMLPMRDLADSIRAKGISRISGALRRGPPLLVGSPIGFGWEWEDLAFAYGATSGDLMFNDAFAPARVTVEGVPDTGRVNGRRFRNFLHALETALGERGVAVGAPHEWAITRADSALTPLFIHQSAPLAELLPFFMKPSQNQFGEILLKSLGVARTGVGSADSGTAVIRQRLVAWGIDSTGFVARDGSGLSRHNLLSPETVTRVLDVMRRDALFSAFYDALPIAGVDGTLERRLRGTTAEKNVRGKTGSMDRVRSFSGYVTTADGRMLIFALMANGFAGAGSDIDKSMDAIVVRMAELGVSR
jgi:D-alanyl-D-alanine carboxypeptidase/D-alanyl-D-alanine-endopeptidase (penicillin-binding protein 4)